MLAELGPFPEWLLVGTLLGVVGSVVVAGLFLVANRLYPTPKSTSDGRGDGEGRRRDELRAYLQAIDEPYAEDHFVEGLDRKSVV